MTVQLPDMILIDFGQTMNTAIGSILSNIIDMSSNISLEKH